MTRGSLFHEQTARQRLAALVDPGSFDELLPPPERIITGPYLAQLGSRCRSTTASSSAAPGLAAGRSYIAAQVGQFVGGAVGEIHGAKLTGLFKAAARDGMPCVVIVESGGVRLHEGSAGEIAIAETMRAIFECRAKKVPTIAVIATDIGAYGGMGILSTCCDFRVMTEHGRLGISGPIVIEKWMGKKAYDLSNRALVWKTSGGKTKYSLGDADTLVHDTSEAVREAIGKLLSGRVPSASRRSRRARRELERRLRRFGARRTIRTPVWKGMGVRDVARACSPRGPSSWPSPGAESRPAMMKSATRTLLAKLFGATAKGISAEKSILTGYAPSAALSVSSAPVTAPISTTAALRPAAHVIGCAEKHPRMPIVMLV